MSKIVDRKYFNPEQIIDAPRKEKGYKGIKDCFDRFFLDEDYKLNEVLRFGELETDARLLK